MKVILFSSNSHKIREIEAIFGECVGYREILKNDFEVLEDGESFEENAKKKVQSLLNQMRENLPPSECERILSEYILMSEDSGICIEKLGGKPGIYSARYANVADLLGDSSTARDSMAILEAKDAPSAQNNNRIINELKKRGLAESRAYFVSCVCVYKNGRFLSTHGFLHGKVVDRILGNGGFGYDPIFIPKGYEKSLGELESAIKNQISHRFYALKNMEFLLS